MGLTSFFKRKTPGDASASGGRAAQPVDAVERVRTRTRQRLIGAVVLLTIGVIGFPLVFESQPRPIPVDIPIEIPRLDTAPALVLPVQRREVASASAPVSAEAVSQEALADPMLTPGPAASAAPAAPTRVVAGGKVDVLPAMPAPVAEPAAAARTPEPAVQAASDAGVGRPAFTKATAADRTDAAAAQASAAEGSARFVVQVGAFADPAAARVLRSKLEKLGLKTYAQVAETSAGRRTRVRLGPFATRAEADQAQARSKEAGIAAVVLTL